MNSQHQLKGLIRTELSTERVSFGGWSGGGDVVTIRSGVRSFVDSDAS